MNSNYPPGVNELPDDGVYENEYLFDVIGEIKVIAYSEEDAEQKLKNEIRDLLHEAYVNEDIEVS